MVLLVFGASHTGKTLAAKKLIEKYSFPCLSLDLLKMGFIRSGYTKLTPYDDDEITGLLWPVVKEMIKTAIENNQDLIIEGCYIPFDWKMDFDEEYSGKIRDFCLVMTEDYIKNHFDDIIKHANDIEKRLCDDVCMEELFAENKKNLVLCEKHKTNYILIDKEYKVELDI